jgi:hypothetical protein
VYEIRSTLGGSGLQFFDGASGTPRVRSIGASAGFQQVIDALLDTVAGGVIVLESAHLNPFLQGQARRTKFSSIDASFDSLNVGQDAPPPTATYTLDRVTIGSGAVGAGKIFYAVGSDTNYVRILVQRDATSGTLLFNPAPNRRIRAQLSYQGRRGVIYAKPVQSSDTKD